MHNAIYEKAGDKRNLAIGLESLALMAQLHIGAVGAAERNLRRSIDLCHKIADELWEAVGRQELGRVLSYRGAWQEAEQEFSQSLIVTEKISHVQNQGITWSYGALRFLLMARGAVGSGQSTVISSQSQIKNQKSAIKCAQRDLELADETSKTQYPHPRDYVRAYWLLGAAYRATHELALAEENLSKSLNLCRQINSVDAEADILFDIARLRYAQGDPKEAQEKASEALVITERSGFVLQGADVNLFLAELALAEIREQIVESRWGKELARKYAEEAKRLATCDGPPYYYKVAYEETERFLEKLK